MAPVARHPRWTFHFTPTSASRLNAVECFFAKLTRQRLKRGVFQSVVDLQFTINRFVADINANPHNIATDESLSRAPTQYFPGSGSSTTAPAGNPRCVSGWVYSPLGLPRPYAGLSGLLTNYWRAAVDEGNTPSPWCYDGAAERALQ
jgi:hypothetical protein